MSRARVLVLGSGFEVRGGVSAMAVVCARHGLFDRWGAEYLATHCDGSALRKLACAARAWLAFAARLARGRVALLHVHLNSDASFWRKALFVVPALAARIPYVLHVHCGGFADFHARRCGPVARAFVRLLLRRASAVVALSDVAAAELKRIDPALAPRVIPNPVELPDVAAAPGEAEPVVLFLGAITEAKGVYDLLRAWPRVLAAVPDARLVLAGEGELERVHSIAREGGFQLSVVTPGWIGGEEKQSLLQRAAVFVLPSHREAMPMALLEAMAAGVPAVATRVGAVPAMVEEGVSALTVTVRDAEGLAAGVIGLLRNRDLRVVMGMEARNRVAAKYSASAVIPQIEALWSESDARRQQDAEKTASLGRMDYATPPAGITGGQVPPPSLPGSRRIHSGAPHQ